jgi:sugar/nucleoside kinase (ribokinase family)
MLTFRGTIAELTADLVDRALLRTARHVHVASYFLHDALRPRLKELLREARLAGASTSVDTNWDPREEWDGGLRDLLDETTILFVNAEEAKRIAGTGDVETAARALSTAGAALVVVKLGAEGAVALGSDGVIVRSHGFVVEEVDSVGAGDSFDAGFLTAHLVGRPVEEALRLANACGALSLRGVGGIAAQPTLAEATR